MTTTDETKTEEFHETVTWIDPKRLVPDPDNPRGELRGIPDLAESVKTFGVLEAITIRWAGPNPIISRGHRRVAAALLAELPLVPTREDTTANDDARRRAEERMVENVQRDGFNPVEEARGVQQLLDLGSSIEEISKRISVPIERVQHSAAIGASQVAIAVTEKHDLTFDQAIALVEFQEDKDVIKALTVTAVKDPGMFGHQLAQFREQRDLLAALEPTRVEWAEKGYKVLTERPNWSDHKKVGISSLGEKDDPTKAVTNKSHAECPSRAVVVQIMYGDEIHVDEYCLEAIKLHKTRSYREARVKSKELPKDQQEKASLERRTHNAAMAAGRAAQEVRREFVRTVLARKVPPPGMLGFVTQKIMMERIDDSPKEFSDLTGIPIEGRYGDTHEVQGKFFKTINQHRFPIALFARVAAHVERYWPTNTWRSPGDFRKDYLRFLVSCGYTPSLIEKVQLGEAKVPAVLKAHDELRAASKGMKTTAVKTAAPSALPPGKPVKAVKRTAVKTAAGPKGFRKPAKRTVGKKTAVKRAPAVKRRPKTAPAPVVDTVPDVD